MTGLSRSLSSLAAAALFAAGEPGEPGVVEQMRAAVERLWRKPDPEVDTANTKVRRGDPKGALDLYEKAGGRLTDPRDQAALAFDRSAAYIAEGAASAPQAAEEARRALESVHGELHAKAAYNLGFALAEAKKRDEAIEAYGKALRLRPDDDDARYNLELLLREQQQQQGGQGQQQQDQKPGQKDDKKDQQQAQGKQPQQQKDKSDEKKDPDQKKQEQAGKGQDPKDQQQKKEPEQGKEKKDQEAKGAEPTKGTAPEKKEQQAQGKPVDRTEAQRLLDALRASEKNLQVWRFGQRRDKPQRPRDVAKDW